MVAHGEGSSTHACYKPDAAQEEAMEALPAQEEQKERFLS